MIKTTTFLAALLVATGLLAAPVTAQEAEHENLRQSWTFGGPFGTFDRNQLQRGFQVFKEVCAGCHSARLLAFRNLSEPGGPEFSEAQVKALAATYQVADPDADGGKRAGVPADHWPGPDQTPAELKATYGIVPPDMSVLAKARSIETPFPASLLNFVTTYSEGGADYLHGILTTYRDQVPDGVKNADGTPFKLPEGKYYNDVFPGHAIGMPPPLSDGSVKYVAAEGEQPVPETVDQYAKDVSAYLMWVAEPHLVERKEDGLKVILFLILFAGIMYAVKQRIWRNAH